MVDDHHIRQGDSMSGRLQNKRAIITGGASGIGAASVRKFVAEGAQVVISDINEALAILLIGECGEDRVTYVECNVGDQSQVNRMIDQAREWLGGIDILFNNAGIGCYGETPDLDEQQWHDVINIDLNSVFYSCKKIIPIMRQQGGGAIVNTASISGLGGDYGMSAYNAAKGAVANYTRTLALDHARDNIRVNALCPGLVDTPIISALKRNPDYDAFVKSQLPAQRPGTPEEMANVAAFLASDEASYVSGVNLVVDGAKTAHTGMMNYVQWAGGRPG
jgi:meso-butanediol dehydrogenase/(S,S)-butanediol dehydrogenase/diacetyl reductase